MRRRVGPVIVFLMIAALLLGTGVASARPAHLFGVSGGTYRLPLGGAGRRRVGSPPTGVVGCWRPGRFRASLPLPLRGAL